MAPSAQKKTTLPTVVPKEKKTGVSALIRQLVAGLGNDLQERTSAEINKNAIALLSAQHKEEIVTSALLNFCDAEELKPYQAELIKMHAHLERTGKKMIILIEGEPSGLLLAI